jgi:hypothetical protein
MGGRFTAVLGLLCLAATLSFADPPMIQVEETLSDRGEFTHVTMAQRDTASPGIYLTGIGRQQLYQAYAVKMSDAGSASWSRLWGQTFFMYDCLWRNGAGRMVGYTTENATNDYKVVLFSGEGSLQDQWDFGGNTRADRAFSSMYYDSVNMLIVGMVDPGDSSLTDGSMVLVDGDGQVEWSRTYHESSVVRRVQRDEFNEFVLFGTADSIASHSRDFWVGHTDSVGTLLFSYRFGARKAEELYDGVRIDANLTLLVGSTHSFGDSTKTNIFVLATNDNGDSLWSDVLGGPENDAGLCILPVADRDSGFVIGGYWSESLLGTHNAFLMKYDQDFDSLWAMVRHDTANYSEFRDVELDTLYRYHAAGIRFTNFPHGYYLRTSPDPSAPIQHPPDPFELISPDNDAFFTVDSIRFTWEPTLDPDPGDQVAYALLVDTDSLFDNPTAIGPLQNSTYLLTSTADIYDRYWRVVAQDQHSNLTYCTESFRHVRKIRPDSTRAFSLLGPSPGEPIPAPAALFTWEQAVDPDSLDETVFYCLFFQVGDSISPIDTIYDTFANVNFTDHPFIHQSDTVIWWVVANSTYPEMQRPSREIWTFVNWNVSVDDGSPLPQEFALHPPYPNPFNATATLEFSLVQPGEIRLDIFDLTGRLVTTLAQGDFPLGNHHVQWTAHNASTGLYFARLTQGTQVSTRKLLMIK